MKFWLEFFRDKRFAWDFKISNFIMKDSLRNYLAIDGIALREIAEMAYITDRDKRKIAKIIKDFDVLMTGKE